MKINIMDYDNYKMDLHVSIDDVGYINVVIMTGDELIAIYNKIGELLLYADASDAFGTIREKDYLDGHYTVTGKRNLLKWIKRKHTYEWSGIIHDVDWGNKTNEPLWEAS